MASITKVMNLKLQEKNGYYDLVFKNGGFDFDTTMRTSLIIDINTDKYMANFAINQRSGNPVIDFGNELWTLTKHTIKDPETKSAILNIITNICSKYREAGVWDREEISIVSKGIHSWYFQIITYTSLGNQQDKYYIPIRTIND